MLAAVPDEPVEPPGHEEFHILTDTLREIRDSIRDLRSDFRFMGGGVMFILVIVVVGLLGLRFTLDTPMVGVSATPVVEVVGHQ